MGFLHRPKKYGKKRGDYLWKAWALTDIIVPSHRNVLFVKDNSQYDKKWVLNQMMHHPQVLHPTYRLYHKNLYSSQGGLKIRCWNLHQGFSKNYVKTGISTGPRQHLWKLEQKMNGLHWRRPFQLNTHNSSTPFLYALYSEYKITSCSIRSSIIARVF